MLAAATVLFAVAGLHAQPQVYSALFKIGSNPHALQVSETTAQMVASVNSQLNQGLRVKGLESYREMSADVRHDTVDEAGSGSEYFYTPIPAAQAVEGR